MHYKKTEEILKKQYKNLIFSRFEIGHMEQRVSMAVEYQQRKMAYDIAELIAHKIKPERVSDSCAGQNYIAKVFVFTEEELAKLIEEVSLTHWHPLPRPPEGEE